MQKLKIVLVQLPPLSTELNFRSAENVPLAAGYLKSFAAKKGLLEAFDIDILDQGAANFFGDSGIIREILGRRPHVVGFSSYSWNTRRNADIAKRIKEIDRRITIITGGPDVQEDNAANILPWADKAFIGEGEAAFCGFLEEFLASNGQGPACAAGLGGKFVREERIRDINDMPSPYLSGFIDPARYSSLFLEASRGCGSLCAYCSRAGKRMRIFSTGRLEKEIALGLGRGVNSIGFYDSNFNLLPSFKEVCSLLAKMRKGRRFSCYGTMKAEFITARDAKMLKDAGFVYCSVGLQSLNDATLRSVFRRCSRQDLFRGVQHLIDEGIKVKIDNIIGLPKETLKTFERGVETLKKKRLFDSSGFYKLSLLPGTRLKGLAPRYGIVYDRKPPYLIRKSRDMSAQDIAKAFELVNGAGNRTPNMSLDLSCSRSAPPGKGIGLDDVKTLNAKYPITQINVEAGSGVILPEKAAEEFVERVAPQLSNLVLINFTGKVEKPGYARFAGSFLKKMSRKNPNSVFYVVVEDVIKIRFLERLKRSMELRPCIDFSDGRLVDNVYFVRLLKKGDIRRLKKDRDPRFSGPERFDIMVSALTRKNMIGAIRGGDAYLELVDGILWERGSGSAINGPASLYSTILNIRTIYNKSMFFENICDERNYKKFLQKALNSRRPVMERPIPKRICVFSAVTGSSRVFQDETSARSCGRKARRG